MPPPNSKALIKTYGNIEILFFHRISISFPYLLKAVFSQTIVLMRFLFQFLIQISSHFQLSTQLEVVYNLYQVISQSDLRDNQLFIQIFLPGIISKTC